MTAAIQRQPPFPAEFGLTNERIAAIRIECAKIEKAKKEHLELSSDHFRRFAYAGAALGLLGWIVFLAWAISTEEPKSSLGSAAFRIILVTGLLGWVPAGIGALLAKIPAGIAFRMRKDSLPPPEHPADHAKLLKYEDALRGWEGLERERKDLERRKAAAFWTALDGWGFEREIATLYRQQGFEVEETPGSGDGGVDLILRREGKKWIVQCKQHTNPVPPAVVRDLFGTMVHERADSAILVATTGFTPGTREFAAGKPITLVDLDDILKMARIP